MPSARRVPPLKRGSKPGMRRPQATPDAITRLAKPLIQAVTLALKDGVGARKVLGLKDEDGKSKFPADLKYCKVHKALQKVNNAIDEKIATRHRAATLAKKKSAKKNAKKKKEALNKSREVFAAEITEEEVGNILYPARPYAQLHILDERHEEGLVAWIEAMSDQNMIVTSQDIREHVANAVKSILKKNRDSRYTQTPVTTAAARVASQPGGKLSLPSAQWITALYKRHSDRIWQFDQATKDVARTATIDPVKLAEDLLQVGKQCAQPDIAIMTETEDGMFRYVEYPGDTKLGRDPGFCARCRLVQVDEKGQFIWYDHRTGQFKFQKVVARKGKKVVLPVSENREMFTFVPWADANGHLLFVQLIFQNAHVLSGHIPDNIHLAPVLLQAADNGVQTGKTLAEAVKYLRAAVNKKWEGDEDILGTPGNALPIVYTTDGHASRYDVLQLNECLKEEIKVRPNIRLGASSWLTQMWDQIFHKFTYEYTRLGMMMVTRHNRERTNKYDVFVMSKRTVSSIVASMHHGGVPTWVKVSEICGAWEKVGFTRGGISVSALLDNPLISGAAASDTRFKKANGLPQPVGVRSPPQEEMDTPEGMRRGHNLRYLKFQVERLKAEKQRRLDFEETYFHYESRKLTAAEIADTEMIAQASAVQHGESLQLRLTINSETGDILGRGGEYIKEKRKRAAEQQASEQEAKKKKLLQAELTAQFMKCSSGTCSCGRPECMTKSLHFCQSCFMDGRPSVQKSQCKKEICDAGKVTKAALAAAKAARRAASPRGVTTPAQLEPSAEAAPAPTP
mmetsp:Transcript_32213/g.97089  ORF Transcript_32213/g.97089 Transcript_32213/m.97089 type:complete len:795 (-) Transcript_32213:64-2448(-)